MAVDEQGNAALQRDPEEQARQIRQELEFILKNSAFRGSKRCQLFLRYVVDRALEGCDLIKERSIGIEVFGRKSSFDPGDDSIVRVTARDVRSRLSQFNLANKDRPVWIELPPGSYVPEFHWPEAGSPYPHLAGAESAKPDPAHRRWQRLALLCALLLLGVALWMAGRHGLLTRPTALERFWSPLVNEREPVLICAATPVAYDFRAPVRQRFGTAPPESSLQVMPIPFPPDGVVYGREIAVMTDTFVGEGDAQAIAQFAALLARMGKRFELKTGPHTSLGDLRRTPAILIGAYTNEWSGRVAGGLPFVFSMDPTFSLRETGESKRRWIPAKGPREEDLDDYALITRVWDPTTRQPILIAGGIMNYGTQAAGEFLSNPAYMAEAFRNVSSNWSNQNIQIALHVTVIGKIPGAPRVIALKVW